MRVSVDRQAAACLETRLRQLLTTGDQYLVVSTVCDARPPNERSRAEELSRGITSAKARVETTPSVVLVTHPLGRCLLARLEHQPKSGTRFETDLSTC